MRGYAAIGLDSPKSPANVGSALRACGCYGASMLALGGSRPRRLMKTGRLITDTQKVWRRMPVVMIEDLHDAIPFNCVPVAVDLVDGATSLFDYVHPERAFYVFGPEDGTLGKRTLDWCRDTVYVPTTFCMNLAATVNVVLYDRASKGATRCKRNHETSQPSGA